MHHMHVNRKLCAALITSHLLSIHFRFGIGRWWLGTKDFTQAFLP